LGGEVRMKKNWRLKLYIFNSGMKQKEVAEKAMVDPAYISHAVRGKMIMNVEQRQRVADVLGVEVDKIFEEEGGEDKVL